MHLIKICLWI